MPVYEYESQKPEIDPTAYVFPNATIIGNISIGANTWVGPGAVLRGDYGRIEVGSYTAVEDNCVIHARPGEKSVIGDHVTLGHSSVVHTGRVSNWAVIGMHAVISDFAEIGEWAAVAEGAVVKNRGKIGQGKIAVGIPAREVSEITESYRELWTAYKQRYNDFCGKYRLSLAEIA